MMRQNLLGRRFGRLLVVEYAGKKKRGIKKEYYLHQWKCLCDCGRYCNVCTPQLNNGSTKSCGCLIKDTARMNARSRRKDLTGQQFGRLTVLKCTDKRVGGNLIWECLCVCGNTVYVRIDSLHSGNTRSCGCLSTETRTTQYGLSHTQEYKNMKTREYRESKKRYDLDWTFAMERVLKEFQGVCVLCGVTEEENINKNNTRLSVDHMRPLSGGNGLTPGNAILLCGSCNSWKGSKALEQLPAPIANLLLEEAAHFKAFWEHSQVTP